MPANHGSHLEESRLRAARPYLDASRARTRRGRQPLPGSARESDEPPPVFPRRSAHETRFRVPRIAEDAEGTLLVEGQSVLSPYPGWLRDIEGRDPCRAVARRRCHRPQLAHGDDAPRDG